MPAVVKVPFSQRYGRLECVFDLPAVPASGRLVLVRFPMFVDEAPDHIFLDVDVHAAGFQARNVLLPDLLGGCFAELRIVETDVDSRSECFIEFADPVRREDNDPRIVFKHAQENLHNG